ncbi:P-loop containing nucleoside triphosphate hydrolase protein [Xylaria sp. CBS 124048]|nr:P-loop containing nucleoside triphosphate hydrolase protein [Xylaria sp. CBS 124048]
MDRAWGPIIYLSGATATGKGTLGKKLAAQFDFYHISMGDLRRSYLAQLKAGAPEMDEEVRRYIQEGKIIPEQILKRYNPVPVLLNYHNHRTVGGHSWTVKLALGMIEEKMAELRSQRPASRRCKPVIIDGHPLTAGTISIEIVTNYLRVYSGLTIVTESPRAVAKQRYLSRSRLPSEDAARFESRMELTNRALPPFLEFMALYGEVLRSQNDENMTIDEAYYALLRKLEHLE